MVVATVAWYVYGRSLAVEAESRFDAARTQTELLTEAGERLLELRGRGPQRVAVGGERSLLSVVEDYAAMLGIRPSLNVASPKTSEEDGIITTTLEVTLKGIPYEKGVRFLQRLETGPEAVRVAQFRLDRQLERPDTFTLTLQLQQASLAP